jgi:hypothetical protein
MTRDRVLTQDECDAVGVDGRDGRGVYRWSDLTDTQRARLRIPEWRRRMIEGKLPAKELVR